MDMDEESGESQERDRGERAPPEGLWGTVIRRPGRHADPPLGGPPWPAPRPELGELTAQTILEKPFFAKK